MNSHRNWKTKLFGVLVVTLVVGFLTTGLGWAKTTIKVGHVLAPTHPYQIGLEKFGEMLEERTDGQIEVDVFHSAQLGGEREMIEALQMGTLDMALVSTAPLSGFTDSFLVYNLPYIFQDRDGAYKVLDGEIGTQMLESLKDNQLIGLCYWENGFRNVTNSVRPINNPEDMKGLKIRTMENKIHMASFDTIGADATPMSFGELFTALQQGTMDAQENPLPIIYTSNFFEVQDHLALTEHFYAPAPLIVSQFTWNKLSKDQQQTLREAALEARDFERKKVQEMDDKFLEVLKDKGMQVTDVDKEEWKEAMSPVYDEFEDKIGSELIEKVTKAQQ